VLLLVEPVGEIFDVLEDSAGGVGLLVVLDGFADAVEYADPSVIDEREVPMRATINRHYNLIKPRNTLPLQRTCDHLRGLGEGRLRKKRVQHLVLLADLERLGVDHLQVRVDYLVVEPTTETEGAE